MQSLLLVFTESQHLVEVSPVVIVSFQHTAKGDFYKHYYKGASAYVWIL